MCLVLGIMRISSRLLASTSMAIALTAAVTMIILLGTNLTTIANAQQHQQQESTNQTAPVENRTFQSTIDNFRVQVPEGWIIHDMENTGFTLVAEVLLQGYGILAQLCPQQEQQQQQTPPAVVRAGAPAITCQEPEQEIIHIIRYPNLGARLGFTPDDINSNYESTVNTILSYEIQKLQEVGYTDINIVNSTDTTVSVDISPVGISNDDNDNDDNIVPTATVPAKLLEMTFSTNHAPNETKRGHFILTATNVTPRTLGEITGYSIFYEDISSSSTEEDATTPSSSLPAPIRQLFDSFELIASEEVAQAILAALASQSEQVQQLEQLEQTITVRTVRTIQTVQTEAMEEPITPLTGELVSNGTEGIAPATFEFDADISGGREPYNINWDFDDGDESNGESVVHTFDEAGTYVVTATVTDSAGQTATGSIEISVEEPAPPADGGGGETECDSSYPDDCIRPPPPDLDCGDDGVPENFEVLPPDPHGFDADNDGIGCEDSNTEPEEPQPDPEPEEPQPDPEPEEPQPDPEPEEPQPDPEPEEPQPDPQT
jgi:PKD repeat protein